MGSRFGRVIWRANARRRRMTAPPELRTVRCLKPVYLPQGKGAIDDVADKRNRGAGVRWPGRPARAREPEHASIVDVGVLFLRRRYLLILLAHRCFVWV